MTKEHYEILLKFKKHSRLSARDLAVLFNNKNGVDHYGRAIQDLEENGYIERTTLFIDLDEDDEIEYRITEFGKNELKNYRLDKIKEMLFLISIAVIASIIYGLIQYYVPKIR